MSKGQIGHGHPHLDRRSLEMARIVVQRIDADPALHGIARENLERWRRHAGGTLTRAHREWEALLERPWSEIRTVLLDDSEEGQRLRSSHPFKGIVTDKERRAVIDANPA